MIVLVLVLVLVHVHVHVHVLSLSLALALACCFSSSSIRRKVRFVNCAVVRVCTCPKPRSVASFVPKACCSLHAPRSGWAYCCLADCLSLSPLRIWLPHGRF